MRAQRVLRYLVLNAIAVGIGATVAASCISVNYPTVAFRCNPRQSENCPETHTCCSDDPATVDGGLPAYEGKGIAGSEPLFSGAQNGAGTAGMCVRTDDIPAGSGLLEFAAANCPIPCNPSPAWSDADRNAVCGTNRVCCQTVELEPTDCVMGDDGVWRPVTGGDIPSRTNWGGDRHVTHQDPGGSTCLARAGGDQMSDVFLNCIAQLSVADQRGFCMALGAGQQCPTSPTAGYLSACDQINMMIIPPPVAGGASTTAAMTATSG